MENPRWTHPTVQAERDMTDGWREAKSGVFDESRSEHYKRGADMWQATVNREIMLQKWDKSTQWYCSIYGCRKF